MRKCTGIIILIKGGSYQLEAFCGDAGEGLMRNVYTYSDPNEALAEATRLLTDVLTGGNNA